ncbi:MAG: GNAT family N-acetyltransferase, partial [Acetobacteraceae bacterium]
MTSIPRPSTAGRFDPERLFRPSSVAVIGAGTEIGSRILANLVLGGFRGPIAAAADATMLSEQVDLAVIATEPADVVPAMEALAAKVCFAAIVPVAAEGLQAAARRTGVRVLGAHAFGLAIPALHLNATLSHMPPPPGRLALVSQSSGLARAVIDWAGDTGVGFSTVAGIGGNADIGHGLVLDWLSREPGTGAILLVIRRLKDRRAFLSAARAAARLRPVVALHDGMRHDGTPDLVFEAALRRAGVLSVGRLEDLLAAAETL